MLTFQDDFFLKNLFRTKLELPEYDPCGDKKALVVVQLLNFVVFHKIPVASVHVPNSQRVFQLFRITFAD